jgi:hypothetical protein
LRFLIERAETLADRLESLVRAGRPMAGHEPPPAPAAPRPTREPPSDAGPLRSQAERDLLRALSIGTGKGAR